MKILHILDRLNHGGIEGLELDLCRNAAANDLDLVFVSTNGGQLENDFAHSGTEYIRLRRRLPVDLLLVAQLRSIMKARDVRIVHCHQAVDALHAYLATMGTPTLRVLTFHGWQPSRKDRAAINYLIPRMDRNLAVSRACLDHLTELGFDTSQKFQVLYNGVDGKRLAGDGRNIRAELGLKNSDVLLGMVANFYVGVKDQITVCRALPRVFAELPNAHFAFVGGRSATAPELFEDCVRFCREHGIADRVHFLGTIKDIAAFLHALDIFVFSSIQEGLPNAVIEAMMVGLPVVVSDIPPLLEVTGDGAHALTFHVRDADDLARQLIELIKNPEQRTQLGTQGKQWATEQFSIESHIARLKKLYGDLVAAG